MPRCAKNAYFDPNSGGGEMVIPLDDGKVDDDFVLAVRSMDYYNNYGKKDGLLGEVLVYVAKDLLESPGQKKSFLLKKKGSWHQGEITLSAVLTEMFGKHFLRLICHQTTGLANVGWDWLRNVCVQCYRVPSTTDVNAALPKPEKITLPAGFKLEMPFSFKLPDKYLPSSFSALFGEPCHVSYSLYSVIDIKMNMNPSIAKYITVLSAELPSPYLLAPIMRTSLKPHIIYGCYFCGLTCGVKGNAFFRAAVDKTYFSPGDAIFITAFAQNDTKDSCAFTVFLTQMTTI